MDTASRNTVHGISSNYGAQRKSSYLNCYKKNGIYHYSMLFVLRTLFRVLPFGHMFQYISCFDFVVKYFKNSCVSNYA